jgi:hypothetical protein
MYRPQTISDNEFINDGYVIAKLGNTGRVMLGLSSDDSSDSYKSIDYALYADSGIGNKHWLASFFCCHRR